LRLRIKNVQSIEELDIEWDGLATLSGPTMTGKTAVHRSLEILLEGGRFNLERILRNGAQELSIELWHNKNYIGFFRSLEGENTFKINDKVWTKIGSERPQELEGVGFKIIKANGRSINPQIASQDSGFFLVGKDSDSTTRAEAIVGFSGTNLKIVTEAVRAAAALEKKTRQQENFCIEQKNLLIKQEESVKELDVIGEGVKLVFNRYGDLVKSLSIKDELVNLRRRFVSIGGVIEGINKVKTFSSIIKIDLGRVEELVRLRELCGVYIDVSRRVKGVSLGENFKGIICLDVNKLEGMIYVSKRLSVLNGLLNNLKLLERSVDKEKRMERLEGLKSFFVKRRELLDSLENLSVEMKELELEEGVLRKEEKELKLNIKVCPLCGKNYD